MSEARPESNASSIEAFQSSMRRLLEGGDHFDVTLRCGDGATYKAHKAILGAHSEFFKHAFQLGKFKEGDSDCINLAYGESAVIEMLLSYMYTMDYSDENSADTGFSPALLNAHVYAAADFYMIPPLKTVAQAKTISHLTHLQNAPLLKEELLLELPPVVDFAYGSVPQEDDCGLKKSLMKLVVAHAERLLDSQDTLGKAFADILEIHGAFARDFAIAMLDKSAAISPKWAGFSMAQCQQCRHVWADERKTIPQLHCPACHSGSLNWDFEAQK